MHTQPHPEFEHLANAGTNPLNTPNTTRRFQDFHISYTRRTDAYGSDTTAIVLRHFVFFILNGNHLDDLANAAERDGIHACMELFIDRLGQANPHSEHRMAVGVDPDHWILSPTALDILGQKGVDRLKAAIGNED